MICKNCGEEMPETGACPRCGKEQEPVTAVFTPKHSGEPEEKPGVMRRFLQKLRELLLGNKLVLPAALLMLLTAVGIAAASRYRGRQRSVSGGDHPAVYTLLESLLPKYGTVPEETALHVADASGVIAAYVPSDREMVLCRISGKDLLLDHYEQTDGETCEVFTMTESKTFPAIFETVFASSELTAVIRAEQSGMTVNSEKGFALHTAPAEPVSAAVIRIGEKSRSWELSSYVFRDYTGFRTKTAAVSAEKIALPDLTAQPWTEAAKNAETLGFTPEQELAKNDSAERGTVFSQSPPAGSMLVRGTPVYLTVAADEFLFRYTPPEQATGSYTVILYDAVGKELARGKWNSSDSEPGAQSYVSALKCTAAADFQAVLENAETGETASLGSYTTGQDASAEADSETLIYAFTRLGGLHETAETTAPSDTPGTVNPEQPEWMRLYRAYLENGISGGFKQYHQSSLNCTLVYLDGDDIPEMIVGAVEQNRRVSWICSVQNGKVTESGKLGGSFRYLEKQNRIFSEKKNSYYAEHLVQSLEQGELKMLQSFEEHWSKENEYSYKIDAKSVERDVFNETLQKDFTEPGGTEWNYAGSGWTLTEENMNRHLNGKEPAE